MVGKKKSLINPSNERTDFINRIADKADSTKKQYLTQYDNIYSHFEEDLLSLSTQKISEYIDTLKTQNSQKNAYNVLVLLFDNIPDMRKFFVDKREDLRAKIAEGVKKKNDILITEIPPFNEIMDYLKDQSKKSFIINYLLINFYVRNLDLDLKITKDTTKNEATQGNWLVINKNNIVYVRNSYKTFNRYGRKIIHISNRIFRKHVVDFFNDHKIDELDLLDMNKIDYEIRKYTYKNLSEAEYLKSQIKHLTETNQITKLTEIGDYRGTNIDLLMKNYNLHFKTPQEWLGTSDSE